MNYLSKTLGILKPSPCLYPLASVRDHSPPTSGGKWSRNGGAGRGRKELRMGRDIFNYLLRKKKQDIQTEGIGMKNSYSMEFSLRKTNLVFTQLNEPHPLSGCPDQQRAMKLRAVSDVTAASELITDRSPNFNKGGIYG